jgi:hypothetical protein
MKHRITADTFEGFTRNLTALRDELALIGRVFDVVKIKMTTFNGDCDGYKRRYKAKIWDVRLVIQEAPDGQA